MKYTPIQYFFWLFSGVEISLLKKCPGDYNRQAGIGFTIFMTCFFAALAGGFAAYRFSEGNWAATVVFGIVWGLLIFSIDRSMVVTLKKDPNKAKQNFWEPFLTRMLLAGLLAFMISIPLEIEIFKGVIDIQLKEDVESAIDKYGENVKGNSGIEDVTAEYLRQEQIREKAAANAVAANNRIPGWLSINAQAVNFRDLETAANQKASKAKVLKDQALARTYVTKYDKNGNPFTTQVKSGTHWNTYLAKLNEEKKYLKEAAKWRSQKELKNKEAGNLADKYRNNQNKLASAAAVKEDREAARRDSLQKIIDNKTKEYEKEQADVGFVRQYVAMENAAKKDSGVMFFLWVIRILFFTIEILPTIVKLKTPLGDYDRMLYNHELSFALSLENNLAILREKEQVRRNTEIAIAKQVEKDRHDQEIDLNKRVLTDIADRQQDIAKRMLKEWHRQEKVKLSVNQQIPQAVVNKVAPVTVPQPSVVPAGIPVMPGVTVNIPLPVTNTVSELKNQKGFSNKVWQVQNSREKEFFLFSDGSTGDNTVERKTGNQPSIEGKWEQDLNDPSVISISFNGVLEYYKITDLTSNRLSLVSTNGIKSLHLSAV
jgi:hypothetical protein